MSSYCFVYSILCCINSWLSCFYLHFIYLNSYFCPKVIVNLHLMVELKDLKREHKKLETTTKKVTKKRLNDRTSDSWMNLRKLKKLKLRLKDKIRQIKH